MGELFFIFILLRFYGFDSPFRFCSPLSFHHGLTRRLHAFVCVCVDSQAVTGKMVTFGYDTLGRPALYMIPSRQNTEDSPRQIQYTVWMLERALDLAGPGVE